MEKDGEELSSFQMLENENVKSKSAEIAEELRGIRVVVDELTQQAEDKNDIQIERATDLLEDLYLELDVVFEEFFQSIISAKEIVKRHREKINERLKPGINYDTSEKKQHRGKKEKKKKHKKAKEMLIR